MRFFVCKGMNNLRKNCCSVWILCKKGENAGGNLMTTRFRPIYINRYGTLLHHHLLSVDDIHALGVIWHGGLAISTILCYINHGKAVGI